MAININGSIAYLEFANDIALLSEASMSSIRAIKFIMRWSKIMCELKINFSNSILYVVNVDDKRINMVTLTLNCKHASLPSIYFGFRLVIIHIIEVFRNQW